MDLLFKTIIWGFIIGIVHYIILGVLYMNPVISKLYSTEQKKSNAVKAWKDQKAYLTKMYIGTQIEIFIITASYLFIRQYLPFDHMVTAFILAVIFTGIRIYERFWNMFIQTTYPTRLLIVELAFGIIGTFLIVIGLSLMPI